MCRSRVGSLVIALAWGLVALPVHAESDEGVVDLRASGYYKTLLLRSQTSAGERYTLDLNRLRLELKGRLPANASFDIQYDNEALLGSYLRTAEFRQQKDAPPPQYWSGQANYVDRPGLYGLHRLYRAQLQVGVGDTDVRIGRQRIAWGTGRFWSPLDLLNPFSPVVLEREERVGVDALLIEHKLGPVARLSAVFAPSRSPGENSRALRWHDNARGVDYSLIAGRFRGEEVIGGDLAGQIGGAGLRAELTQVRTGMSKAFARAVVGIDYAFANTLTLSLELYQDGGGARSTASYDWAALTTGARRSLARRYVGAHAGYDVTPLLKLATDVVVNLDDHSRFIWPSITYSLRTNLDATLGVRWFAGSSGSEFDRVPDAVYLALQWFF